MVKISPQRQQQHITKSASASTKSLSSPINSDTSAAISQLTAPISPNTNQPQVVCISVEDNKPISPWLKLAGSLLATAGIVGGIFAGTKHFENRYIKNKVLPHIENYTSADNELHITNSIKPRTEIYKLCKELLARQDIPPGDKDSINTFLKTLKINPNTGNIEETHLLFKNGDHYTDGLTEEHIQRAYVILEDFFYPLGSSDTLSEEAELARKFNIEAHERRKKEIFKYMEQLIKHPVDKSIPNYELSKDYLALKVSVKTKPNGGIEVLNREDNKLFSKETNFSNYRFGSLIPQSSSSYSDPFWSGLALWEMFELTK